MKRPWQGKREQPPSHTDDWLMTYADMITLLLSFFAVFFIVASAPKKPLEEARAAVPAPPAQASVPMPPLVQMPKIQWPPVQAVEDTADEAPTRASLAIRAVAAPVKVEKAPAERLVDNVPVTLPQIVDDLKAQQKADIEQQGDRITTIEINSAAFFDSGSATLSNAGKSILRDVAVTLKSGAYDGYQITVEGHTDDIPINTVAFPSNWELSTARASAVVHFFLDQGIAAQKLRAAGYADTFPKAPNRDAAGNAIPENQAQNRRVVIKLEKIEKTGLQASR